MAVNDEELMIVDKTKKRMIPADIGFDTVMKWLDENKAMILQYFMNKEGSINNNKIYEEFLGHWGLNLQLIVAIEEFSELIKEITKFLRVNFFFKNNMHNEIVDAQIMLNQLKFIADLSFAQEVILTTQKINRTIDKMNKERTEREQINGK